MPEHSAETGWDLEMQFQEWEQKEERQEHSELSGTRVLGSQMMACELIPVSHSGCYWGAFGKGVWKLPRRKNVDLDN